MPQPQIRSTSADGLEEYLLNLTRRRFFGKVSSTIGAGLGAMALSQLFGKDAMAAPAPRNPIA